MTLATITLLLLGILAAWWLSGFDAKVTGEDPKRDLQRRLARCLTTAFLLVIFYGPNAVSAGYVFIPLILIVPPLLGVMWAPCIAELLSGGVHKLIDSDDRRPFDPDQSARDLDTVAGLLKAGRHEEAVELCDKLKRSGTANVMVLETLLARAGIEQEPLKKANPLVEAHHLRLQGKFAEAETILQSLLMENAANVDAALMLMRLYAQDLRRTDRAAEILRRLQLQPHVPPATLEYASRSLNDWSQRKAASAAVPLPESVDELIACGYLGTAIEVLEEKIEAQPRDFDAWLKLAEVHARHSHNLFRAEKIVQKIGRHPEFTAEQVALAKSKLEAWSEAGPPGKPA